MTFSVGMVSLGCPKNQMDAELMLGKLRDAGIPIKADAALADVVIVNTCGFIEAAKQEAIETILEFATLKKEGRIKRLIVTGCMAQRYQQEVADELPECDAVLGLGANVDIVDVVNRVMAGEHVCSFPSRKCWSLDGARVQTTPRFFAFLRIGDGCNNCCTYCAIPHIRGGLRSRRLETLVDEAKWLVEGGVKELILVAQDTTQYGVDLYGKPMLSELLKELCQIDGLSWIRMLYCYPEYITDELLDVMASEEKIVPYLDIPIQHAAGSVLSRMNRTGDRETLTALMAHIREKVPGVTLRTTVMTGFPGETAADFEELCEFVNDVKFDRLGCFAYSAEEGTKAAAMPDQVPEAEKHRRADLVMEQQARIVEAKNAAMVGKTVTVLVESFDRYAECWFGRSAADAPDIDGKVFFTAQNPPAPGDFVRVKITDTLEWDLIGEAVAP